MGTRWALPRYLVLWAALVLVLCGGPSTSVADDVFILHPGYVSGTVSIPGHSIRRIQLTAGAYDPVEKKSYGSSLTLNNQDTYTLVVEAGDWAYNLHFTIYFDNTACYVQTVRAAAPQPGETIPLDITADSVIEGTISVTGETVQNCYVQARPKGILQPHPQASTFSRMYVAQPQGSTETSLQYALPVFGGDAPAFRVGARDVRLTDPKDFVIFADQDAPGVPLGETRVKDLHADVAYLEGTVTVNGATIKQGNVGASVHEASVPTVLSGASTTFGADGTYRFPVPPTGEDAIIQVYGSVRTDLGSYGFEARQVQLDVGETLINDYTIDLGGTISGDAVITGVEVDQIQIYGYGPHGAYRNTTLYTEGEYLLDGLIPGEWRITADAYDRDYDWEVGYDDYDYYYYPSAVVEVADSENTPVDLSFTAAFLEGDLMTDTLGVRDYLYQAEVYAYEQNYSSNERAYTLERSTSSTYLPHVGIERFEMFVAPGTWQPRRFDLYINLPARSVSGEELPFPDYVNHAQLSVEEYDYETNQYSMPFETVGPNETAEYDVNYDPALIVPRLYSPDADFRRPQIYGTFLYDKDGTRRRYVRIWGQTYFQAVREARVAVPALRGWYEMSARAYVDGTNVTFGDPFNVYVEPGDIVLPDIAGPEVYISFPPGNHVTHDPCVMVAGTITSDSQVTSLVINGTNVPVDAEGNFSLQVCDLQIGDNPLDVSATNLSGKTTTVIRTVTRINDAPVVVHTGPYVVNEGSPLTLDAGGSTDFENDPLTIRWDFENDGTFDAVGDTATHTWPDNLVAGVLVEVADEFGASTDLVQVTVHNVAPSIPTIEAPTDPVPRGAAFTITAHFADPGTEDTHTASFDWGGGETSAGTVTEIAGSGTAVATHSFVVSGEHTITVTVTDDDGASTSEVVTLTVNTPPVASLDESYVGIEGSEVAFDASGSTDADGDALQYRWDFDSDGTWDTGYSSDPTAGLTWLDDHVGTVTVEAFDGDLADTATATLTIHNVAPEITSLSATVDPTPVGTAVNLAAAFTDVGTLDTHTAQIQWGNGATSAGAVTENDGSGTVAADYVFTVPGVYTLTCTVTDDDGGAASQIFQYVVVYDPAGEFVTGGGQIDSPAGAYVAAPSVTGKASFGFVSKYKKGATTPDGNTQFHFNAVDLMFKSTSYDWLVVAGAKAMFKGEGQIGGAGNYGFLLSAVDGDVPGGGGVDKFRIKIWDKDNGDAVVYDNLMGAPDDADPTTAITHGAIKIHK